MGAVRGRGQEIGPSCTGWEVCTGAPSPHTQQRPALLDGASSCHHRDLTFLIKRTPTPAGLDGIYGSTGGPHS